MLHSIDAYHFVFQTRVRAPARVLELGIDLEHDVQALLGCAHIAVIWLETH